MSQKFSTLQLAIQLSNTRCMAKPHPCFETFSVFPIQP